MTRSLLTRRAAGPALSSEPQRTCPAERVQQTDAYFFGFAIDFNHCPVHTIGSMALLLLWLADDLLICQFFDGLQNEDSLSHV